jgi:hypothetical protein
VVIGVHTAEFSFGEPAAVPGSLGSVTRRAATADV